MMLCAERRARTPARSIDAAIVKTGYGCDCRLANGIYRHNSPHDISRDSSSLLGMIFEKAKQPDPFEPGCCDSFVVSA